MTRRIQITGRVLPGPNGYAMSFRTLPKGLPPISEAPTPCGECGVTCRIIYVTYRDGRREPMELVCENRACRRFGKDPRLKGTPHDEVQLNNDLTFAHAAEGRPVQGEKNVPRVGEIFLEAANRTYGLGLARSKPRPRDSAREDGVDCDLLDEAGKPRLMLQVTRAPFEQFWRDQGRGPAEQTLTPADALDFLRRAIEKKRPAASRAVDLVVDGTSAVQVAFLTDAALARQQDWLAEQGWRAIWVVGPSWVKCLWGSPTPRASGDRPRGA
jgi:hypothetical protein